MGDSVGRCAGLLALCLALPGCGNGGRLMAGGENRHMPAGDGEVMQSVTGQVPEVTPLAPEPGDIWADLAFLKQQPPPGSQEIRLPQAPTPVSALSEPIIASHAAVPSAKTFSVQLTAANSEILARAQWEHLRQQLPDLLEARTPSIVAAQVDGRQLWRLRTGGFATHADATAFCDLLQSRHASCWVVSGGT